MTEELNALQRAYVRLGEAGDRVGVEPDGWIIGWEDWNAIRSCRNAHVAVDDDPKGEGPAKLFGLPVTVDGRHGVYPTHDAMLARQTRWWTGSGHGSGRLRVIYIMARWPLERTPDALSAALGSREPTASIRTETITFQHMVDLDRPRDFAVILDRCLLAVRRLAFTDDTRGPGR